MFGLLGNGDYSYTAVEGWAGSLQLSDVADIAIGESGRIHLLIRDKPSVVVVRRDGSFIRSFGHGIFRWPHGLTISPDGTFYCVDTRWHVVFALDPVQGILGTIGTLGAPCDNGYVDGKQLSLPRSGPPFNRPTAVAIAPDGDLFVSDGYGNARVHRFASDGSLLASWGAPGSGPGQFRVPHSIVVRDEKVIVADRENSRLQFFNMDGRFLDEWTDFVRPSGIALDSAGNIYVCELGRRAGRLSEMHEMSASEPPGRVSVFSPSGSLLARWGGPDPSSPGSFFAPHGIAVDDRGDVYVSEVNRSAGGGPAARGWHSVQKFRRTSPGQGS